ncbi:MAG: HesA/MoeB/ThiF family protein [Lachnospirales bacterium]
MGRYDRNLGTITYGEQNKLNSSRVLVIGCGGLGGFVIEGLSRMGLKNIGICDYDVFEESNLNRQLYSTMNVLGKQKTEVAKDRIRDIDNTINVKVYSKAFPNDDIAFDIHSYDVVVDCLDSIETRLLLSKFCLENNKVLIHGAVGGYYGTLAVVSEENQVVEKLYANADKESTIDKIMGNPFSIVSIVSALQVHLTISFLLGHMYLKKGMYYVDVNSFTIDEVIL